MLELAERFDTSKERRAILLGLLDYRKDLIALGFTRGYQWIDGSFVENVETLRLRPPADVDVVTVSARPNNMNDNDFDKLIDKHPKMFDASELKKLYKVDGYYIDLGLDPLIVTEDIVYWSNLFSHQRDSSLWKGMLNISLQCNDDEARKVLMKAKNHA